MKIKINEDEIILAIKRYIIEIAERRKEKDRYTKFDSENDVFLGVIGELAFKKMLIQKGFEDNIDFTHISELKDNGLYIQEINGKIYDRFDFLLNFIINNNGEKKQPFKIDIKTQKYIGNYNKNWQFAVNNETVKKIDSNNSQITHFVFIFSKIGIRDCLNVNLDNINIEELKQTYREIKNHLKIRSFEVEPIGIIESKKLSLLSEVFYKDEIFRVNILNNTLNKFKTSSTMNRINIQYLSNIDKIIPSLKYNFDLNNENLNNYIQLFQNENNYVRITNDQKTILFPYNKAYLNNQYETMDDFIRIQFSLKEKPKNIKRQKPK